MEISLDGLIAQVNGSQKTVVDYYIVGDMGVDSTRREIEQLRLERDDNGWVFMPVIGDEEDNGYHVTDANEIYQEEADEGARARFEIREQGVLLMEIRLY
jgi:hypothetical protein